MCSVRACDVSRCITGELSSILAAHQWLGHRSPTVPHNSLVGIQRSLFLGVVQV